MPESASCWLGWCLYASWIAAEARKEAPEAAREGSGPAEAEASERHAALLVSVWRLDCV